ncbi:MULTISPECIES: hypothetical protein [Streptomyces]|uniref:Secreted protein n=2 Tax=Streptomyces TaxID=1883 RepID=A0A2U9P4T3_STRAS|nr:hypothetical protein [Streptomyces actuosus]AWT44666.1 hypothetical protein DMT42_21800 [Streptomyces actuosus]MBM4820124.1 hypothetical protein [Streptomyces actuosus]
MPRGRHRHSPPLHRLMPPSAIAGVSLVCAFGPWVFTDTTLLRTLAAVAAATAVVGAAVMRRWDAQAGKQVADLARARASDEWRHEERVAELETDLEESRELRAKLEQRLRAKRAELAGLRNEHAALLRRYATAETERASALEGRRLLEIEAAAPVGTARALPPARVAPEVESAAPEETPETAGDRAEETRTPAVFSPEGSKLFLRAQAALARFDTEARAEHPDDAERTEPAKPAERPEGGTAAGDAREGETQEDGAQGKPEAVDAHARAAADPQTPAGGPAAHQPAAGHFAVPTAVAVVPAAPPARRPAAEGGFDFFGTKKAPTPAALEAVQNEDLADVVGEEAFALHKAEAEAGFKPADEESRGVGQVIDLTAHDETEQIDVQGLRSAVS